MNARIIFGALLVSSIGRRIFRRSHFQTFVCKSRRTTLRRVLRRSSHFRTGKFAAYIQPKSGRRTFFLFRRGVRQSGLLILFLWQRRGRKVHDICPISLLFILSSQLSSICLLNGRYFNTSRIGLNRRLVKLRSVKSWQASRVYGFHRSLRSLPTFITFRLTSTIVYLRSSFQLSRGDLTTDQFVIRSPFSLPFRDQDSQSRRTPVTRNKDGVFVCCAFQLYNTWCQLRTTKSATRNDHSLFSCLHR